MDLAFLIRKLDILVYPPAFNILLLVLALVFWRKRKLAFNLVAFSTITLLFFSMNISNQLLSRYLEVYPAINPDQLDSIKTRANAIVVLGGGVIPHADEYNASSLGGAALERLRYAAYLQTHTGLPLLTSGAGRGRGEQSEAITMQRILSEEFSVFKVKAEANSRTTAENAEFSSMLLRRKGFTTIFLVTSSIHMARARLLFEQQGINVIPAPTGLYRNSEINFQSFIPGGGNLSRVKKVLHEYLGILWYRLTS